MSLFSSLRVRNYRLFAAGQVVSLTGTWGQRVAQDWLVLGLSHNSGTAIGLTTGLQFAPTLLLTLYGGVLADRYPKRRLLIITQVSMGVTALALGILDVAHVVTLWQVYLLAALLGVGSAFDTPTRQAFVSELVDRDQLANAVSLNSATFNTARVIGPAVAGVMISSVGTGVVFLANAASFLAVILGLALIRDGELHHTEPLPRRRGQLGEAFRYIRARPDLLMPILLVAVVGTFGFNFQITTALLAKTTFHRGPSAYGLLSTAIASGSLIGALLAARRARPRDALVFGSCIAFGVLEVVAGVMPSYLTFLILLIPTGVAALTFTTAANATVQLGASPAMRGRVMAVYVLVFLGGTPFGAPIVGWVAQTFGARWSLIIGGVLCAVAAVATGLALVRARQLRIEPHLLRRRPHVHLRPMLGGDFVATYDEARPA
ncbi:MAG TPA: MFS transporter [Mycobacteriales bacterium]|nr:MFS transporter [Mycobacteriales bacterium]